MYKTERGILAWYYVFNANISFTFQVIKVLGRFVNCLVIFRYIWKYRIFLKGLVKFIEKGNFEDLVLF